MTAYPGEEINISVVTVGQLNGVAPGILQIQPVGSNILELHNTNAKNCMTIQFKPVKKPYSVGVLGKPCSKRLDLNFSGCPLGFEMSNKTNSCDCEELQQMVTTISCNAATNEVMREHSNNNIWSNRTQCSERYHHVLLSYSATHTDGRTALMYLS